MEEQHSSPVVILKGGQVVNDEAATSTASDALLASISAEPVVTHSHRIPDSQHLSIVRRACILSSCVLAWLILSCLDAKYTPRDPTFVVPAGVITSYQWCFVGYVSNMILTLIKVAFEAQPAKIKLHMVSCYINLVAAGSYAMLWTGFSPIVPDVGSCLFIPQRWMLYVFTVPAIFHILGQISDYTPRQKLMVDAMNVFIMITGGLGTIPWISWPHKVFWYIVSPLPFPAVLTHMWRMMSYSLNDATMGNTSRAGIKFVRVFTIGLYWSFPIMYYAAIMGLCSMELLEPVWAALDWLIKMVYSSSLMETNFFVVQRRESVMRAVEEANKIKTIRELSTAIERKDDFLSAMSHELRTPLNGIIGLSESLELGSAGQMPDKAMQVLSSIKHSGKRLLQLINDVLDAAKMKQGQLVIKRERVDVKLLVNDVLDISAMLVRKNVKLIHSAGVVPIIIGDTGRIVQILYNLVGNAAKFTKQGSITVTTGVSRDGKRLFIAVADTGCGVPKDKISKIFGAFEQADMSTTRHYGGTGLGLHLVKELVKAHNGDITVESELGRGSTFTVWLPISGEVPYAAAEQHATSAQPLSDERLAAIGLPRGTGNNTPKTSLSRSDILHAEPLSSPKQATLSLHAAPSRTTTSPLTPEPEHAPTSSTVAAVAAGAGAGAAVPARDPRKSSTELGGAPLVLSVDDDPINQMVVENLLTPEGYEVEQAMDGAQALQFLEECTVLPDLILLDVMMPGMTGYEVCREICRLYRDIHLPIIMVSAKGNPEDVQEGLQAGAQDYVKKPFHRQELLSRIQAQLSQRPQADA